MSLGTATGSSSVKDAYCVVCYMPPLQTSTHVLPPPPPMFAPPSGRGVGTTATTLGTSLLTHVNRALIYRDRYTYHEPTQAYMVDSAPAASSFHVQVLVPHSRANAMQALEWVQRKLQARGYRCHRWTMQARLPMVTQMSQACAAAAAPTPWWRRLVSCLRRTAAAAVHCCRCARLQTNTVEQMLVFLDGLETSQHAKATATSSPRRGAHGNHAHSSSKRSSGGCTTK